MVAYINYVGGGAGGFYKFFKKYFVAQGTIELNITWPSHFSVKFQKIFHGTLCITASGNISLKLFMAPLETIEVLTF